jgi:hypothetical protein
MTIFPPLRNASFTSARRLQALAVHRSLSVLACLPRGDKSGEMRSLG